MIICYIYIPRVIYQVAVIYTEHPCTSQNFVCQRIYNSFPSIFILFRLYTEIGSNYKGCCISLQNSFLFW